MGGLGHALKVPLKCTAVDVDERSRNVFVPDRPADQSIDHPAMIAQKRSRFSRLEIDQRFFAIKTMKSSSLVASASLWSPWTTTSAKPARSSMRSSSFLR